MNNRAITAIAASAFLVGAAVPTIAFESHPELRAGLNNLMAARADLNKGSHDFHGYRVKAIGEINEAINDVNMAMRSDQDRGGRR
ncbi:MAG: hypothetical protein GIX03_05970 [Candidatus Eremiobacteraeota bacterium]|nr:hypothetical protein [Candidatus Eremiobacteraeota bacterium]MBC5802542.1 hypothetical protein [Candidatus Eremiobacteraeota bacterium]MBC5821903.1 hypothetical protein [Candidatus Eremiobacteraeota bacterium]